MRMLFLFSIAFSSLFLLNQCSLFNRNSDHSKISLEWRVEHFESDNGFSYKLSKSAIVGESILYPHNNTLKKLDINTGEILAEYIGTENHWYQQTHFSTIGDNLYVFSGNRNVILKFDYDTFDLIWEKEYENTRFGHRSSIAVHDDMILIAYSRQTIEAYDSEGNLRLIPYNNDFEFNIQNSINSFLTFGGSKRGHRDSTISIISRRSTESLERVWLYTSKMGSSMAGDTPLHEEDNRIYATFHEGPDNTPGGIMVCINGETGQEIWSQLGWFEGFAVDETNIYGHSGSGVYAYDKYTGKSKWRVDFSGHGMSGIDAGNGYVAATHGDLDYYDAETGVLIESFPAKEDGFFYDVMYHDGYFFATTDFSLFKLKID